MFPMFERTFRDPPEGYLEENEIDPHEEPGYQDLVIGVGRGVRRMRPQVPVFYISLGIRVGKHDMPIQSMYYAHSWEDAITFGTSIDEFGYGTEEDWDSMLEKTVWKTSWSNRGVKRLTGSRSGSFPLPYSGGSKWHT